MISIERAKLKWVWIEDINTDTACSGLWLISIDLIMSGTYAHCHRLFAAWLMGQVALSNSLRQSAD